MPQPVWVLSVDLQTKTATFQSGMGEAAKAARSSFTEIKAGAQEMGASTSGSMKEARHGIMLLGEEFGVHLPRGVTMFLASLGPVAGVMEAAFPFLAIAVGATLLLKHLATLKEEGEKLSESQIQFGTSVANVFNSLDAKLLEAGIKADELNENHLGALNKQLMLIDHQSMNELVTAFNTVAKAADATFAQLKASWYQIGAGSAGAQNALTQFKNDYDSLLAQGKDKEASDLLSGTLHSAQRVLDLQKQARDNQMHTGGGQKGDYNKFEEARLALKRQGIDFTEKEVTAQQTLVSALEAQANVQIKVNELKKMQDSNAVGTTEKKLDADSDKADREQNQQRKAMQAEEDKLYEEHYREVVSGIQQSEREKIEATEQGSAERLAAIDSAIKEENAKGLQDTGYYKSLLTSRVQAAKQEADEEAKIKADLGKEEAEHIQRMGELQIAAEKVQAQLRMSTHRVTAQEILDNDIRFGNEEYQIHKTSLQKQIDALDKGGKDYEIKLKSLQDRQKELAQAHENQITAIQTKAEEQRNARILSADTRFHEELARGLTQSIMRHQSFASMMSSIGSQIASGMIENALKSIMADDMTKPHDAAKAARDMFKAGAKFPFPANIVMAPALGALAFATVMAFESGGIVPGMGHGDTVPAMLTPGEAVLPKSLTESLSNAARSGSMNTGPDMHFHHSPTYHVSAIDGAGMDRVLAKHSDKLAKHFENHVRKLNQ